MRGGVVAMAVLVGLCTWPSTAGAQVALESPSAARLNRSVTGTFSGNSYITVDVACPFVRERFSGTFDPDRRGVEDGTYYISVCNSGLDEVGWVLSGTFELNLAGGVRLLGTAEGHVVNTPSVDAPFDFTLTVTDSVSISGPIRGTITVAGTRTVLDSGSLVDQGTFRARLRHA